MKYQTKPVEVEAIQWDGGVDGHIGSWAYDRDNSTRSSYTGDWVTLYRGDRTLLTVGFEWWLIWDPTRAEFSTERDDIFKNKYEELNNA